MDPNLTATKVRQMLQVLGDGFEEKLCGDHATKMLTAANNLVYLARERGGCELIHKASGFQLVRRYLIASLKHRQVSLTMPTPN